LPCHFGGGYPAEPELKIASASSGQIISSNKKAPAMAERMERWCLNGGLMMFNVNIM